jgi:hypothetical protein
MSSGLNASEVPSLAQIRAAVYASEQLGTKALDRCYTDCAINDNLCRRVNVGGSTAS